MLTFYILFRLKPEVKKSIHTFIYKLCHHFRASYFYLLIDDVYSNFSEKETSEASLLAMESQKKSAEREFDRVNDELKKIQNCIVTVV